MEKITEEKLRKITGADSYRIKGIEPSEREIFSTRVIVTLVGQLGGNPVRKDRLSYWIPLNASRNEEELTRKYREIYDEFLRNRQTNQ